MLFPSNARTATGSVSYTGAVTQTDELFATGTRTILQYQAFPGRFVTNVNLFCGDYNTLSESLDVKPLDNLLVQLPCYGAIKIRTQTSNSADIRWTLTYVDYDITSVNNFATLTPYTGHTIERGGVTYEYDPLKAQIGIGLYLIAFVLFVAFLVKLFRS